MLILFHPKPKGMTGPLLFSSEFREFLANGKIIGICTHCKEPVLMKMHGLLLEEKTLVSCPCRQYLLIVGPLLKESIRLYWGRLDPWIPPRTN